MRRWRKVLVLLVVAFLVIIGTAAAIGHAAYRQRMAAAVQAWDAIAAAAPPATESFDPVMVAGLPEVVQRYFTHAIAPGTPLATTVELEMAGRFLLGDKDGAQQFEMHARQILSPPHAFVWLAEMANGPLRISGSDGLLDGEGWTRFWMFQTVPLVQAAGGTNLNRGAAARPALEAVWAPASLLPQHGAHWQQTGPDTARVTFGSGETAIAMDLVLDAVGRPLSMSAMRWSDVNPDKTYRLQPFGGTLEAEATFLGFTIPSVVRVGNHFGTPGYFPFFQATITDARYR